jgi:aspartate kinase
LKKEAAMKVLKFGGGCLRNTDHFLKVADIIITEKEKTTVVISAVFGITNLLIDAIHMAVKSEKYVPALIKKIRAKHKKIATEIVQDDGLRTELLMKLETKMKKLERLIVGISYTEEISLPVKAHILSYGERLAALLLSYLIKEKGKKSLPMEADTIGMVTDQSFENATALLPEVNRNLVKNVAPFVNDGIIPIITGYFGHSKEGKITTFGRNGSDYSAAVVANALDADVLEIWKDVNGFMSADPKMVKEAKNIDRLSYYEAAELSYFGAKILYPRTVEPLIAKDIPLHIKNLCDPGLRGTLIQNWSKERKNIVKSITYNRNISILKIYGPGVGYKPGIIAEVGGILSTMGINIYSVFTSQTCINLLLDKNDSRMSQEALQTLTGGVIERISRDEDIALVSVVGKGLLKRRGVAAKVFSAVARENINVEMISSGASEVASYFIVLEKDLEQTIRAVHKEFFS